MGQSAYVRMHSLIQVRDSLGHTKVSDSTRFDGRFKVGIHYQDIARLSNVKLDFLP